VSLDHVRIRPAFDLAPLALAGKAAPPQRTHPATPRSFANSRARLPISDDGAPRLTNHAPVGSRR
jgi:hypothetical protein